MKKQAILIVAVLFLLSAMAYGQEQKISVRSDKAASAVVISKSKALYSQMTPLIYALASQIFPDYSNCILQVADDFTVTTAEWTIEKIAVIGNANTAPPPANSFEVFFYEDNGGLPGTEIYHGFGLSYTQNGSLYEIDLNTPAVLTAGTYWISVMPNMSHTTNGQWFWQLADGPQAGYILAFRDPCGLVGERAAWTAGEPYTFPNYDMTFTLYGTDVPPEVPLSKWVLLFSVLIIGTWIFIRRI